MAIFTAIATAIVGAVTGLGFTAVAAAGTFSAIGIATSVLAGALAITASALITKRMIAKAGRGQGGGRVQLPPATDNKIPIIYGTAYAGGPVIDAKISTDLKTMWYVVALAEHTDTTAGSGYTFDETEIYYDNKKVQFGAAGVVTGLINNTPGQTEINTNVSGKIRIWLFTNGYNSCQNVIGADAQTILSDPRIPVYQRWTSTDTMTNCAFAIVRVDYDTKAGTTSLGGLMCKITNSLTSPGEVIKDYMLNTRYGCAIPLSRIDTVSLAALDAYSAVQIPYDYEGNSFTQNRYTINGPVVTQNNCLTNLQELVDSSDSWLQYSELTGKWKVVINKAYDQVPDPVTINDLFLVNSYNLVGGINIAPIDLNETYNQLEVSYPNNHIKDQTDYQLIELEDYVPEVMSPNEAVNKLDVDFPLVNNAVQAKYLAIRRLLQSREDLTVTFQLDYSGIQVEAGDVIRIQHEEYGWDVLNSGAGKLFRVVTVNEEKYPDGSLGTSISAIEYNNTIYADFALEDFRPDPNTGLQDPNIVGEPGTPVVTNNPDSSGTISSFNVQTYVPDVGSVLYMDFNFGTSSNIETHKLYRTISSAAGIKFENSNSNANTYTYLSVDINDLPASSYYFSTVARNDFQGANSGVSNIFVWAGAGINAANIVDANGVNSNGNVLTSNVSIPNLSINANVYVTGGTGLLAGNTYVTSITSNGTPTIFEVTPTPTIALVNANIQIITGGINGNAIVPNTMPGNRVQPNTLPGNTLIANTVNGNSIIANTVNGNVIIGNTVNGNVIIGNTVNGNVIIANSVNGNVIIANTLNGNTIQANTINGNTIIGNTVNGNTIIANTLNGNTIKANTLNGNTIIANTVDGNTIIANTLNGNSIIAGTITGIVIAANTLNGNTIIANTLNGNTVIANTLNGNSIIANTVNGNTIIANTVNGNSIIANTLNGNSIIANTIDGNTIIANTINGNSIQANTLNGNRIIANTLNGNTIIANTINGNSIIANTLNGNTIIANTMDGNVIIANTLNGNTIIANTMNGNVIIANTLNGNRIIANTMNGNVIIANTLNGNTIQANTMNGNVIIANTLNGNSITANTLNGNTIIANTMNGNVIIANTLNGNSIQANTINGNTVIANTLNGNSIQAFSINGGVAFIAGTIQAQAIAANTITFENLAIGAVTQSKSTISDPIVQPVPFTNVPNTWPNNTRCIVPSGGVTIIPSTDPGSSANTEYTEGSRIQVSYSVKIYVDPGNVANASQNWDQFNLVEIWKSGASSTFDRGINTIRQCYDLSGNATSATYQQLHAYGYDASGLDLYSSDGGNSWSIYNGNSTSKTVTGAFTYIQTAVNALPISNVFTNLVGLYQARDYSNDGGLSLTCTGTRSNLFGGGSELVWVSRQLGLVGANAITYRTNTAANTAVTGYNTTLLSSEMSPDTGGNGYPYRNVNVAGNANVSAGVIITGTNGDIFYSNTAGQGAVGSGASALSTNPYLRRENVPGLFKDLYASYSNPMSGTTYTAVVVGQSGTILRSERTISASDFANSWDARLTYVQGNTQQPVITDFYAVAGDNTDNSPSTSVWVAVGQYGMIQASTDDGDTWDQVYLGNSIVCDFNAVRYGNGIWVTCGDGGNIYISNDASNANAWTQIDTGNLDYTNGSPYGSIYGTISGNVNTNARQLNTVNYNGEWDTWSIGGQGIILYSDDNANTWQVAYEIGPSEVYDFTRLTYFGSGPNVANVSRPPAEQRILNNQIFSGTILDTGYVAGQETTYYLVIGNMNGNTILAGQVFLQVQEIKR